MSPTATKSICLACSVFREALEQLRNNGKFNLPTHYTDSMLHMHPEKLHLHIDTLIGPDSPPGRHVLLVYGDCHAFMQQQEALPGVGRVSGSNCVEIFLGPARYHTLRKQKAFFLLPEWTYKWQKVFETELGLTADIAPDFMQDMHDKIVYLDSGYVPVPSDHLKAISQYTGLKCEVLPIKTDCLINGIRNAMRGLTEEIR